MNIALIADDGKKELMVQFCIAYCGILAKHDLSSTFTTGRLISEATGLKIRTYLHSSQGCQQLDARIAYNEIDLVLFSAMPRTATLTRSTVWRACATSGRSRLPATWPRPKCSSWA